MLNTNAPPGLPAASRPVKPENRLRSHADVARVAREGRRLVCPQFAVSYVHGSGPSVRVGFSIARRLGSAVVRNRVRRRLREAIRPLLGELAAMDILVVPRAAALSSGTGELRESFERVFADAGLLRSGGWMHNGGTTPD